MSTHISGGSLGFAFAPLVFAPAASGLAVGLVAGRDSRADRPRFTLGLIRRVEIPRSTPTKLGNLRPYAKPLTLLYIIVVLRTPRKKRLVFLPL